MPSCRARARLMAGWPWVVGTTGRLAGDRPSRRMARASSPADRPWATSDTVTEARLPWCTRSIQKLASGSRLCSATQRCTTW